MTRIALWLGGMTAIAAPYAAWADGPGDGWAEGHMWSGGGWWMLGGPLMFIIVAAVVIALVVLAFRWIGGPSHSPGPGPRAERDPMDILKARFARGEIDREEYEERRRILEG